MKQYLDLVSHINTHGKERDDRTGEGTISVFGYQMRFNLLEGFPLVTAKKTKLRAIVHELLWFLSGSVSRDDLAIRNAQLLPHEFGNQYNVAHLALRTGGYERWEALGLVKQNLIIVATRGLCEVLGLCSRDWSVNDVTPDTWEDFLKCMVPPNNIVYGFCRIHEREKLMEIKASVHTFCEGVGCPLPTPGKTTIWDEWTSDETGTIGPMYGQQWRSWPTEDGFSIDQIRQAVRELQTNPMSRRIIVNAWNPEFLPDSRISPKENVDAGNMALAPCHSFFQFYVEPATLDERIKWATQQKCYEFNGKIWEHMELNVYQATSDYTGAMEAAKLYALDALKIPTSKLSCQLYQRSADCFLGVPFNIASYSLLTMMMAQSVGMMAGDFIWTGGDVHLYKNHSKQVALLLSHKPHPLPKVLLNPLVKDIDDFVSDDIVLFDYVHGPHIAAPVAV